MSKFSQRVTIIIPFFNAQMTIARCVKSVQKQKYNNIDVILINDCSTDKSITLINSLISDDSRFKIFSNDLNQGPSVSRNIGLKFAAGTFIYFLDADDHITDTAISDLVMNSDTYDLICSGHIQEKKFGVKIPINHEMYKNLAFGTPELLEYTKNYLRIPYKYTMLVHCWNKLYRNEIIVEKGLSFNEDLTQLEDVEFNFRYLAEIDKLFYLDKYNYFYVLSDNFSNLSSQAGLEENPIENCCIAFKAIKDYILKQGKNTSYLENELKHHFVSTSIIYMIRLMRAFLNKPKAIYINKINIWLRSSLLQKAIPYYVVQPGESKFIKFALMTKSIYIVTVILMVRHVQLTYHSK